MPAARFFIHSTFRAWAAAEQQPPPPANELLPPETKRAVAGEKGLPAGVYVGVSHRAVAAAHPPLVSPELCWSNRSVAALLSVDNFQTL